MNSFDAIINPKNNGNVGQNVHGLQEDTDTRTTIKNGRILIFSLEQKSTINIVYAASPKMPDIKRIEPPNEKNLVNKSGLKPNRAEYTPPLESHLVIKSNRDESIMK